MAKPPAALAAGTQAKTVEGTDYRGQMFAGPWGQWAMNMHYDLTGNHAAACKMTNIAPG
jgi:hypothetical protein